jgi:uncharacterized protein (TIGR03083 family)
MAASPGSAHGRTDHAELLDRALGATGDLVAGVRDDQWDAPTPCTAWSVRDLVNHFVGGNLMFADIPAGHRPFEPPQPVADDAPAIDRLAACLGRQVPPHSSGPPPA